MVLRKTKLLHLFAHITQQETPSFWLAALVGFVAGVAVTLAMMARRLR
jgi:hypothetical protein